MSLKTCYHHREHHLILITVMKSSVYFNDLEAPDGQMIINLIDDWWTEKALCVTGCVTWPKIDVLWQSSLNLVVQMDFAENWNCSNVRYSSDRNKRFLNSSLKLGSHTFLSLPPTNVDLLFIVNRLHLSNSSEYNSISHLTHAKLFCKQHTLRR